ncbi:unnamed protein product [Microthlaspi erraticum]|uniref:Uncharacterized protein n=1 Tax=Microthlaspi erraticum TaxID=1685480 RepID=A0A6D2K8V4_9BRAS|nr:unnamed protein product [Microthlaspi erraticum]
MRGTTDEEDGVTSVSDVVMLSEDVLISGEDGEDSFGFGFTGEDYPHMLCFSGGNDVGLLFQEPSSASCKDSTASPVSSLNNICTVDDKPSRSNKKITRLGDGQNRVCDSKPGKRCKRDQKKSSVENAKVKKVKVGEKITALQQLVSPYGKDDEDNGDVSPTIKVKELKSNGLCLVPLAWTEHVANTNGADLWSPSILSPTMNHS